LTIAIKPDLQNPRTKKASHKWLAFLVFSK